MAYERLQAVVGTAIVDPKFRYGLLEKSPGVLSAFGLTSEESHVISSIKADTLQGFATQLEHWMDARSPMMS